MSFGLSKPAFGRRARASKEPVFERFFIPSPQLVQNPPTLLNNITLFMSSIPTTQKALFVETFPGPVVVRDRLVPRSLAAGDVLVKIISCEVSPF